MSDSRYTRAKCALALRAAALLALAGAAAAITGPALAQQSGVAERGWSVGGAVLAAPRPYPDASHEVIPVPLVQYESPRWYVQGIMAGYRFVARDGLSLDVHLQPRFDGFENDDSPILEGMDEPDPSLDVGLGLDVALGKYDVGVALDADVLGRSEGYQARIDLGRTFVYGQGRVIVGPELGVTWKSEDVIDYYYGVAPSEARSGRPAYSGESGTSYDVGGFVQVRLNQRWSLLAFAEWTSLATEVTDSPIVEDDAELFGLVGLLCRL